MISDDGGGGGKCGTSGAGVIIYLALEIGPADTAGHFNGRTMLELTKTKTKHQLGDFFFHFSFAFFTSACSLARFLSFSLPRFALRARFIRFSASKRIDEGAYTSCVCVVHLCHFQLASSRAGDERAEIPRVPPHTAAKSHALNCTRLLAPR